jgi:hypothetical protein
MNLVGNEGTRQRERGVGDLGWNECGHGFDMWQRGPRL